MCRCGVHATSPLWSRPRRPGLPDGKPDPAKDPDTDDDGKLLPSVAWTTFHNWGEVGNWYRALAEERAQPTDALRAKANELTAGVTAPDRQVQALYEFVSAKTRYVGIDLGMGRYQPHSAAETLSNQYGDCKDKDTLLEALLRAKGFTTAPALIGVGITPVPDLPSPALFNHVITTVMLPDKMGTPTRIWLDSTPGAEPYRVLIPQIRGQQALIVPPQQPASLVSTPAEPPFPFHEMFTTAATLDSAGLLTGHMTLSVRSDAELVVRQLQRTAAPAQWDSVAQYLSNSLGFSGTVSHASLRPSPEDGPASLTWDYRRSDYSDWSNRRILPLFPVLEVPTIADDKQPDQDIDQGTPRTLEAVTRITLPSDYRADLPSAVHITRTYATYDQSYALSGGLLTITRKTLILQKKVPKADWKDYAAYIKAIGNRVGTTTAAAADKKAVLPADSAGDTPVASATQLMARAQQQMKQNDIAGEKATLLELEKKAPDTPYTYSMLGYLAARENHFDEAETDFKKELANHPDDDANIPILFASVYGGQKKYTESVTLLQSYEARGGVRVSLALASYQQLAGDNAGAVGTLQRATTSHGDDRQLLTAYASALHAAHRETEAAAVAKAAMDESNDAFLLNNNSYVLAETGNDLDLAEKKARQAIDLREAETAAISVAEANSAAFNASLNLVAAYDTLAYILLKEGKPEAAEPYQQAAWFGSASITIGDHLALIQEAMHHPDDALTTDELALATSGAAANKPDYAEVQQNADRLRKAGAHSHVSNAGQQLQMQRTFKVPRLPDAKGWGTFRVQVGAAGIVDSDMVSGSPAVKPMTAEVNKLKVSGGVPPASHAKLLRDGVLSCSAGQATCEFVLMPQSGLGVEGVRDETRP